MEPCKHFHMDGAAHIPCPKCQREQAEATSRGYLEAISNLQAKLAEVTESRDEYKSWAAETGGLKLKVEKLEKEKSERYKLLKDNTYTMAELQTEMVQLRHKVQCIAFNMMDGIGSYDDDGTIDDILHTYWEALEKALKPEGT